MGVTRRQLEEQLVAYSRLLHQCGWVANHDGNLTARLAEDRILATPTAVSKAAVDRGNLIVVDDRGDVVSGTQNPFSELNLHLYIYRQRPDAHAVIHSHAPHATALSVAGMAVEPRMLPEPVVSLGTEIPLVPYAAPKSPESTLNLSPFVDDVDAVSLENHGLLSWGPDLETAYLRMELVEHLARIQLLALQAGGLRAIPEKGVAPLLESRTKAGLGQAGRKGKPKTGEPRIEEKVEAVVREEIGRALRR